MLGDVQRLGCCLKCIVNRLLCKAYTFKIICVTSHLEKGCFGTRLNKCLLKRFFSSRRQPEIAFPKIFTGVDGLYEMGISGFVDATLVSEIKETVVKEILRATSLQQCLSFGLKSEKTKIKSQYFDKANELCYLNSGNIVPKMSHEENGTIYYCEYQKVRYTAKNDVGSERVIIVNEKTYLSCKEVFYDGFRHKGIYKIRDPTHGKSFIEVLCDGGWTVFQRREDGSGDFNRVWNEYVSGFGNKAGEFWLGLETIYQLTSKSHCELYVELFAGTDSLRQTSGYARYSSFRVEGPDTNYTLRVSGFEGNVGDSLSGHSGYEFSTRDRDNDKSSHACAEEHKGGWWYSNCFESNLNGEYLYGHLGNKLGIVWRHPWSEQESLKKVEMKLKCA